MKVANRYKAFTLVELLLVLILSLLIVMAGFYALQLIEKQFYIYKKNSESILDHNDLSQQLLRNCYKAKYIECDEQSLYIHFDNNRLLHYQFKDDYVLLDKGIAVIKIDSFFIKTQIVKCLFQGEEIHKGMTDFIQLNIRIDEQDYPLNLRKEYSAYDLINLPENPMK